MISNTDGITNNSPIPLSMSLPMNSPSERKLIHQFSEVLDVKPKTSTHRLGASKSNQKAIISGNSLWYSIPKRRGKKRCTCKNRFMLVDSTAFVGFETTNIE